MASSKTKMNFIFSSWKREKTMGMVGMVLKMSLALSKILESLRIREFVFLQD